MYGEFSYDLVPGAIPNDVVLIQVLQEFDLKPNGNPRKRCNLLSDTMICEIQNSSDYEETHQRLHALRGLLGNQFNYTFSLRRKGDPLRVRGVHDEALAHAIINS